MTRLIRGTTRDIARCIARGITTAIDCSDTGGLGPVSGYVYANDSLFINATNAFGIQLDPTGEFLQASLRINRTYYSFVGGTPFHLSARTTPNNYRYAWIPEIASGGSCWSGLVTSSPSGVIDGGGLMLGLTIGTTTAKIQQYTLPQPWEIRQGLDNPEVNQGAPYYDDPPYTPVSTGFYNTNAVTPADSINDLRISADGTRLAWIVPDGVSKIVSVDLTVPFSVLGGVTLNDVTSVSGFSSYAMYIPPEGGFCYLCSTGLVSQFEITGWDPSTIDTGSPVSTLDISAQIAGGVNSIYVVENHLYVMDTTGTIFRYSK